MVGAGAGTALAAEVAWTWRRLSIPRPSRPREAPILAGQAIAASGKATAAGYREASLEEQVAFGVSGGFAVATVTSRAINYWREQRQPVRPIKNLKGGSYRVHHYMPGIALAFVSGAAGTATRHERVRALLAVPWEWAWR